MIVPSIVYAFWSGQQNPLKMIKLDHPISSTLEQTLGLPKTGKEQLKTKQYKIKQETLTKTKGKGKGNITKLGLLLKKLLRFLESSLTHRTTEIMMIPSIHSEELIVVLQ